MTNNKSEVEYWWNKMLSDKDKWSLQNKYRLLGHNQLNLPTHYSDNTFDHIYSIFKLNGQERILKYYQRLTKNKNL